MIANSLPDWFTNILNLSCLLIFVVLGLWHWHVLNKLYQAHRKLNSMLTHDTQKSAINSYKDRLHKDDWYDYYIVDVFEFSAFICQLSGNFR